MLNSGEPGRFKERLVKDPMTTSGICRVLSEPISGGGEDGGENAGSRGEGDLGLGTVEAAAADAWLPRRKRGSTGTFGEADSKTK